MLNKATIEYVSKHLDEDVAKLALKPSKDPEVDMRLALQQIYGQQKAKYKLPEYYQHKDVFYPLKISMEQCSSEATAIYKASVVQGDMFVDLSGGFGVDTIHLARNFKHGVYVEQDSGLCDIFSHNAAVLGCNNVSVRCSTMENYLEEMDFADVIYIDPARRDKHGQRVYSIEDCTPNVLAYKDILLQKCNTLMLKLSPMIDIAAVKKAFNDNVSNIHIVAVDNECKELLCLIEKNVQQCLRITAVDINACGTDVFTRLQSEEIENPLLLSNQVSAFLYEPNSAIMKSGLFKSVATEYQVPKLSANTNLYTSDTPIYGFPGRCFEVERVLPFRGGRTAKDLDSVKVASIAVRNFPLSVLQLRKTLKIKDGDGVYIFATTLSSDEKVLIVCRKQKKTIFAKTNKTI